MVSAPSYKAARAEKIRRPPNSFILYRSAMASRLPSPPPGTTRSQADVSRLVAQLWHNETAEVKAEYRHRAHIKKLEHEAKYPDYSYKPRSREEMELAREMKEQRKSKGTRGCGPRDTVGSFVSTPHSSHHANSQSPTHCHVLLDQALFWKQQNDELEQALNDVFLNVDGSFGFDQARASFNDGLDTSLGESWRPYGSDGQFDIPHGAAEGRLFDQYNNSYPTEYTIINMDPTTFLDQLFL